jgi:hypothetical protein
MRVRIKRNPRPQNAEAFPDRDVGPESATEEVEVPATPFAVVGAISALATTLITLLTFWMVDKPDADVKRGVDANQAQVEILQRALQVEDAQGRETAFRLMSAMGLLKASNPARVDSLLNGVDSLPHWPAAAEGAAEENADEEVQKDSTVKRAGTGNAENDSATS